MPEVASPPASVPVLAAASGPGAVTESSLHPEIISEALAAPAKLIAIQPSRRFMARHPFV
jgi:hypothetical protein